MPRKNGSTLRDNIEAAEQATDKDLVEEPEVPAAGEFLWICFWELDLGRGGTGWGPAPLAWADMAAWAAMNGIDFGPWESRALRRMDLAWMSAAEKLNKKK
jgi:hypothetical protein